MALALFLTVGNAQENTLPVSTVYATQGNVARRQSLEELEMLAAVQAAREKKALMAAMASYSMPQQVITTPEQFLLANPPRVPAPRNEDGDSADSMVKKTEEVPAFDSAPGAGRSPAPPRNGAPAPEAPPAKVGFLDLLKGMNRKKDSDGGVNPYVLDKPAPMESTTDPSLAESGAPKPPASTDAVGGIFKRGGGNPTSMDAGEGGGALPAGSIPEVPPLGSDSQATNPGEGTVPSASEMPPQDAPIFRRQTGTVSGELASLKATAEADVGGVLVSVWEGTQVKVLSQSEGIATIQLPDQRIGTIKASALAR